MSKTAIVPAWLLVSATALLVFDAVVFDMRQRALTDGANAERAVNSFLARKKEEKEAKERAVRAEQLADANLRDGREVAPMPRAK